MTTCPRCDGKPSTDSVAIVRRSDGTCTVERGRECELCGGAGSVSLELAERVRLAREWRDRRVAAFLSIHEVAKRTGTPAVTISAAERGLIEMPEQLVIFPFDTQKH